MTRFYTDSLTLHYSNVESARQWWIDAFDCKQEKIPEDWDNPLPSDVALRFANDREPTILLSATAEVEQAGLDLLRPVVFVVFCDKVKKAHEQFSTRGILTGPI